MRHSCETVALITGNVLWYLINVCMSLLHAFSDWFNTRGGSRQASSLPKMVRNEEKNNFFTTFLPSEDKTTKKIQKITMLNILHIF